MILFRFYYAHESWKHLNFLRFDDGAEIKKFLVDMTLLEVLKRFLTKQN